MSDKLIDILSDTTNEQPDIERAVIAVNGRTKLMIAWFGDAINTDHNDIGLGLDEAGPTQLAPDEDGLWLWEGTVSWVGGSYDEYNGDYNDAEPIYKNGKWRRLTDLELNNLACGDFAFLNEENDKR